MIYFQKIIIMKILRSYKQKIKDFHKDLSVLCIRNIFNF